VLIFHGKGTPMPMPTSTEEQRRIFADQVASELPAFVHWLTEEWEIPAELLTYADGTDATRFGFREYHHAVVRDGLFDETPQAELLALIDMAVFEDRSSGAKNLKLWDLPSYEGANAGIEGKSWHGPAIELENLLKGQGGYACTVSSQMIDMIKNNRLTTLLSRLHAHPEVGEGKRICKADVRRWKGWLIGCPGDRLK
jgi:hypothetical protein